MLTGYDQARPVVYLGLLTITPECLVFQPPAATPQLEHLVLSELAAQRSESKHPYTQGDLPHPVDPAEYLAAVAYGIWESLLQDGVAEEQQLAHAAFADGRYSGAQLAIHFELDADQLGMCDVIWVACRNGINWRNDECEPITEEERADIAEQLINRLRRSYWEDQE
jgi:hypothetical protein